MKILRYWVTMISIAALTATTAWAQQEAPEEPPVPAPPDPLPEQPALVEKAGVGGEIAYGRAGVLELGGSAGITATRQFSAVSLTPTVGWFFADNIQASGILSMHRIATKEGSGTLFSLLAEPSYHYPFTDNVFGFLGLGFGAAYASGPGVGLSFAPRVGANILVGRSGILTPYLSYQYNTHETVEMPEQEAAYVAVSTALMLNIGYTVMW